MSTSDRARVSPASGASRWFSAVNLLLPTLVLGVFVALRSSHAAVLDWMAPVVFWLWLAVAPVAAGLAIRSARRDGAARLVWLNVAVLAVWGVGLAGSLLLH